MSIHLNLTKLNKKKLCPDSTHSHIRNEIKNENKE